MSSPAFDPVPEVRSRADIVEIIGETVVLKRSGRNFTGLCPFHQERSPSFNVNPERQIFRCFGCGEGGDVFSFVMKAQHLTFPEALRSLADRYGVQLPDRRPDDDDRTQIRHANEVATSFFQQQLLGEAGSEARKYLASRGLTAELVKRFQLGFAPPQWDALHRHLNAAKVSAELQDKAALARPRPSGGYYDYFRNRIIFPIHNEAGQVVGFGGRVMGAGEEPKYLNSPETALYRKGHLLYGLNQARDAIRARDCALLMEGYMDVIAAHAFGFEHAVGVLGTALTPSQARVLLRYTPGKRIVIAFDADRAGQAAAEKGLATLTDVTQGVGLDARVAVVPEGKDPDAYLRKEGTEAFGRLLEAAPTLYTYLLERAIAGHDTRTPEGRDRAVSAVVPILRQIGNYVTQDDYVKRVSQRLGLREESLRLEITKGLRHNTAPSRGARPAGVKKLSSREAERILLFFMIEQPGLRQRTRTQLAQVGFDNDLQEIRERIEAAGDAPLQWTDLLDFFSGKENILKTVSGLMFEDYQQWAHEPQVVVENCIDTLESHFWEGELASLRERIKNEGPTWDPATQKAAVERLQELNAYCVQLKHKRSNLLTPQTTSHEEN